MYSKMVVHCVQPRPTYQRLDWLRAEDHGGSLQVAISFVQVLGVCACSSLAAGRQKTTSKACPGAGPTGGHWALGARPLLA